MKTKCVVCGVVRDLDAPDPNDDPAYFRFMRNLSDWGNLELMCPPCKRLTIHTVVSKQ